MAELSPALLSKAAEAICNSKHGIAFTGAGISLESGVPTFRGSADSIWNRYDPEDIELGRFLSNPKKCWGTIKACFYDFMQQRDIKPNLGHLVLAALEREGLIKAIVTQNIDCLHQAAGSKNVLEFHGTTASASCLKCGHQMPASELDLTELPPKCPKCGGVMKPDFVFFGEGIPTDTYQKSFDHARRADLCIVCGTGGEVMPAGMIPQIVHQHGGFVVEINPNTSSLTHSCVDVYLPSGAVEGFSALTAEIAKLRPGFVVG